MNEELKQLFDSINEKKREVKNLVKEKRLEDAEKAKKELVDLQKKFNLLYDLEEEKEEEMQEKAKQGTATNVTNTEKNATNVFAKAFKAMAGKATLTENDREILDMMQEGSDEDGGLTVPKDVRTKIKELRRAGDALEPYVNVERVTTDAGSRIIEQLADETPFDNIEEAEEFPEFSTPKLRKMEYKIKKKGGILKITREVLLDSAENLISYLRKWICKKAKATRNFMIVKKVKEITAGKEIMIENLNELKKIFNVELDPAFTSTAKIITNQDGINWLDNLKTEDGKYALQPDPTQKTKMLLFGQYEVKKIGNRTLPSIDGNAPFICGDLKEAITIFDRETLTIETTGIGAGTWERDIFATKVRERLDIQAVDKEAIIMACHSILTEGKKYKEKELQAMTKEEILSLAGKMGLTLSATSADKKEEIIKDFLEKQK